MKSIIPIISLATLLLAGTNALAQTTGTRLGAYDQKIHILWFDEPQDIAYIRRLLQEGHGAKAVEKAREYAALLSGTQGGEGQVLLYFALNALCAALTKTGETEEAVETCGQAIDLISWKWQAYNNRGTAYYVSGDFTSALQEYRKARDLLNSEGDARFIVERNMELAETRLAAGR
ncbi:MAG: hypothetical protein A3I78_05855 [Gammaproteobacteria bacterium RIFCSPLOWO2_02_FULL_56_15]|nr:MAG: hypothetical protein A3I78_05855 [Gammaproteobacteria bacterium RIFCSPLOWO2_02_FULL_56_15]